MQKGNIFAFGQITPGFDVATHSQGTTMWKLKSWQFPKMYKIKGFRGFEQELLLLKVGSPNWRLRWHQFWSFHPLKFSGLIHRWLGNGVSSRRLRAFSAISQGPLKRWESRFCSYNQNNAKNLFSPADGLIFVGLVGRSCHCNSLRRITSAGTSGPSLRASWKIGETCHWDLKTTSNSHFVFFLDSNFGTIYSTMTVNNIT